MYRDLKPENSVVDSEGYLYLIDLGTAKTLSSEKGYRTFTIIGMTVYRCRYTSLHGSLDDRVQGIWSSGRYLVPRHNFVLDGVW